MNDKQQLAAMGADLRLTEEQANGLAGRVPNPAISEECLGSKYYPLWINTESGKHFYVEVDRNSGEVSVGGDADSTDAAKIFLRSLGELSPVVVPEGWQLVPVEPTEMMLRAMRAYALVGSCYQAMLAASPKPEAK